MSENVINGNIDKLIFEFGRLKNSLDFLGGEIHIMNDNLAAAKREIKEFKDRLDAWNLKI